MSKKRKLFWGTAAVILIAVGISVHSVIQKSPTAKLTGNIIFFYGRECPHCQDVEKFLSDNQIAGKVQYDSVEVWHNQANASLLLQKAKECGIAADQVGVPFVWNAGQCYIGTPQVEAFFQQKAGSQ